MSNILHNGDMGPPPLCSALLLAANAACNPSSSINNMDNDNDDNSSVDAHVDTDDCCDRSHFGSEACDRSTMGSEAASEHKDVHLDESASGRIHDDPGSPAPQKDALPLERFLQQGQLESENPHLSEEALHSQLPGEGFDPWRRDYVDRRGEEDDWSNSRSHSRSPSRSLSPSSRYVCIYVRMCAFLE